MFRFFKLYLSIFFISAFTLNGTAAVYEIFEESGKVGLKDESGSVLIPAIYDNLGWSNGDRSPTNQLIGYKKGDQWGLLSLENKKVTSAEYLKLYPFSTRLFAAAKKGKVSRLAYFGLINSSGKTTVPFRYTSISATGNHAIVTIKNGSRISYGLITKSGETLIPIKYNDIKPEGPVLGVANAEGKWAVYSKSGLQLSEFIYEQVKELSSEYALISEKNAVGLYDATSLILPTTNREITLKEGELYVTAFNQWDILSATNDVRRSYYYESMQPYGRQYLVKSGGNEWIINESKEPLTDLNTQSLFVHSNGLITFQKNRKWGLLDKNYSQVIAPRYDSLVLNAELIFCKNSYGKWLVFDHLGVQKSSITYEEIGLKTEYLWPVKRKGHWGFIERSGNEIIPPVYDKVGSFTSGNVVVGYHGEQGVIDKSGQWIVFPTKADLTLLNNDLYLNVTNQHKTLKSIETGTIYFTENPLIIKENYLLETLSDGRIWKIDFKGRIENNQPRSERFEEIRPPSEGLFAVKIDDLYGFIDHQNRLIIANRYENVGDFNEGLAPFKLIGKWGFIDKKEKIIIQPIYDQVSAFENGTSIAKRKDQYFLIGKDGKPCNSTGYDQITPTSKELFIIERNDAKGILDKDGRILVNTRYQELEYLKNGYIITKKNDKYGLITEEGVDIIPAIYDLLIYDSFKDEYLAMKKSKMVKATLR